MGVPHDSQARKCASNLIRGTGRDAGPPTNHCYGHVSRLRELNDGRQRCRVKADTRNLEPMQLSNCPTQADAIGQNKIERLKLVSILEIPFRQDHRGRVDKCKQHRTRQSRCHLDEPPQIHRHHRIYADVKGPGARYRGVPDL